jgi:hypothetical protein
MNEVLKEGANVLALCPKMVSSNDWNDGKVGGFGIVASLSTTFWSAIESVAKHVGRGSPKPNAHRESVVSTDGLQEPKLSWELRP